MITSGWRSGKFLIENFPQNPQFFAIFSEILGKKVISAGILWLKTDNLALQGRFSKHTEKIFEGDKKAIFTAKKNFDRYNFEQNKILGLLGRNCSVFVVEVGLRTVDGNGDNVADGVVGGFFGEKDEVGVWERICGVVEGVGGVGREVGKIRVMGVERGGGGGGRVGLKEVDVRGDGDGGSGVEEKKEDKGEGVIIGARENAKADPKEEAEPEREDPKADAKADPKEEAGPMPAGTKAVPKEVAGTKPEDHNPDAKAVPKEVAGTKPEDHKPDAKAVPKMVAGTKPDVHKPDTKGDPKADPMKAAEP